MANQSIIEHRANYYFACLREDYLRIALECKYKKPVKKSVASPYCKAYIMDILENWMNTKRSHGDDMWVFMSHRQWGEAMFGMFGRSVIIDSLDELVGEGLLEKKLYKMFGRDTWQYRLNAQEVNKRMRDLPDRDPHDIEPQVDIANNGQDVSKNGSDPSKNGHDPSKNGRVASKNGHDPSKNGRVASKNGHDPSKNNQNIDSYLDSNIDYDLDSPICADDCSGNHQHGRATSFSERNEEERIVTDTPSNTLKASYPTPSKENAAGPRKQASSTKKLDKRARERVDVLFDAIEAFAKEITHNPAVTITRHPLPEQDTAMVMADGVFPTKEEWLDIFRRKWNDRPSWRAFFINQHGIDWDEDIDAANLPPRRKRASLQTQLSA